MNYRSEAQGILKTIKRAGANTQIKLIVPAAKGAFSGVSLGGDLEIMLYMAQLEYTDQELADDSLANGLMKIVVSPLMEDGATFYPDFISMIRNKGARVQFNDGRKVSVKVARVTAVDGVTPILGRIYLGG